MRRSPPPLPPDVLELLDVERLLPSVPASVRARSLCRARAALAAGAVTAPARFGQVPKTRWAFALAAGIAGAAVGATGYEMGARIERTANGRTESTTHVVVAEPEPYTSARAKAVVAPSAPTSARRAPRPFQDDSGQYELRLLREARAAVSRRDFAAALVPIGEHARLFKGGRLVEEREALRVRALSGLGLTEKARRAADAFEARFPRSVLLRAVSEMPSSAP